MKKYKKKTYKKRLGIKIFVFLLILGGFAFTIGYGLTYYQSVADFSFETPPDPEDFEEADEELLANVAYGLDARYPKYHLPLNQSTGTTFVNDSIHNGGKVSYTNVSYYHWSDNEALWTGIDYCGWTYKYLSALQESPLNETLRDFSKNVLINMTTGLANLMAVPNGGLGSDYGGIL